jgi:hypothetical protein
MVAFHLQLWMHAAGYSSSAAAPAANNAVLVSRSDTLLQSADNFQFLTQLYRLLLLLLLLPVLRSRCGQA